jgi:hypothetical protein
MDNDSNKFCTAYFLYYNNYMTVKRNSEVMSDKLDVQEISARTNMHKNVSPNVYLSVYNSSSLTTYVEAFKGNWQHNFFQNLNDYVISQK